MRFLFLTTTPFIPEYFSGPNQTVHELCEQLVSMNHEPIVLSISSHPDTAKPCIRDNRFSYKLFRASSLSETLVPLSLALQPDVVVIMGDPPTSLIHAAMRINLPLAIWLFQGMLKEEQDFFFPDDVLVLAGSTFVARRLLAVYGLVAKVVEPFIATPQYLHNESTGKRILFVNPIPEKGVQTAFSLARTFPDRIFTFVESNSISSNWRKICFKKAMQCGNIEWICRTSDMNRLFQQSRLLLLPRFSEEGYCRLICEAQLAGIPILASDRGHIPEQVQTGGTLLAADEKIAVWQKWLDKYYTDELFYKEKQKNTRLLAEARQKNNQTIERLLLLCTAHAGEHRPPHPRI